MKKKKKRKKLAIDFIMLTTSVLLAFVLNSWNESRNDKKRAQLYLDGIYKEINYNVAQLDTLLVYHEGLLNSLINTPLKTKLILHSPRLSKEAWKLSENDVFKSHIDYALYKKLAIAYDKHDILMRHTNHAGQQMSTLNIFSPYLEATLKTADPNDEEIQMIRKMKKQAWINVFRDWVSYESDYLSQLKELQSLKH